MSSLELQGFRASIASDGEKLALHAIEKSEDGSAVTCWIASEEGRCSTKRGLRSNESPNLIDDRRVDGTPLDGLGDIKLEIWRTVIKVVGKGPRLLPCPEALRVRMLDRFDEPRGEITETTKLDEHPIASFTFKYRPI
ncbi:hypothetical protein FIBSPDRAFT_873833, partial [Athelia psychrophila]